MRRFLFISLLLLVLVGLIAGCSARRHRSRASHASSLHPSMPVVSGVTDFSFSLYGRLAAGHRGNVLFSPLSISSAISMAYVGSRGETARQMATVMKYPSSPHLVAEGFGWLNHYLEPKGESPFQFYTANGLWLQKGLELQPDFLQMMQLYEGDFHQVDFSTDPSAARSDVNGWVSDQTNGKIQEMVPPSGITEATRLMLVSSLYMRAPWQYPFSPQRTRMAPFYPLGGGTVQVPMMHQTAFLPYFKGRGFTFLKLPYASAAHGPRLAMLFLMPDNPRHLGLVERRITPKSLREGMGRLQMRRVELALPRFSLKTHVYLSPLLSEMGMPNAFSTHANFSGIDGTRDLMIQQVVHAVTLDVDETGTEAAAATSVSMGVKSAPGGQTVRFQADHPFLFMIIEEQTGAVLFMGRFAQP